MLLLPPAAAAAAAAASVAGRRVSAVVLVWNCVTRCVSTPHALTRNCKKSTADCGVLLCTSTPAVDAGWCRANARSAARISWHVHALSPSLPPPRRKRSMSTRNCATTASRCGPSAPSPLPLPAGKITSPQAVHAGTKSATSAESM